MSVEPTSPSALVLVDVLNDFRHEDGTSLCESFRGRNPALVRLIEWGRAEGLPVVYVNDALGQSRCCREHIVATARAGRLGALMAGMSPQPDDSVVVADACATVDRQLEAIALDYLENVAGATIVSSRRLCRQRPGAADGGRRAVAATV